MSDRGFYGPSRGRGSSAGRGAPRGPQRPSYSIYDGVHHQFYDGPPPSAQGTRGRNGPPSGGYPTRRNYIEIHARKEKYKCSIIPYLANILCDEQVVRVNLANNLHS
ncbi:unnamed protein product [Schistosoma intercalatum]|nr:unnamed protein product [Schistosoma intercalatum]